MTITLYYIIYTKITTLILMKGHDLEHDHTGLKSLIMVNYLDTYVVTTHNFSLFFY